ncbi:TPA: hypothetical protein QDC03_004570 [Burkholderia cepacia]|uniref:hypothetical protein n=1 Tax=Burkholderia cepacia complex TaxID=87882 RepID=UPI001376EA36|nr:MULTISPECIES: hypothetical protein [Burkholderia cepacia complex]HDR9509437.1 hypothetical protein [Burkholderia cepacia]
MQRERDGRHARHDRDDAPCARKPGHRGAVREQHRDDEAGPRTSGGADAADRM